MTEKEIEKLEGFACCHGENDSIMVALREEVCKALNCESDGLVSAVVYSLQWDYDVEITGIPCDMWSAVKSEHRRHVTDEEYDALPEDASSADEWVTEVFAYIQCDRIEDGFALTWKTWKEWKESES